jgi:hypothetical protein
MFKLIVNANGLLSACPTVKDFVKIPYHTTGMALFDVRMSEAVWVQLSHERDNAFILADGLPERVADPSRVYFAVVNNRLNVA